MKYDLVKFHHWLLLSTFRNKWFEENIKLQIISLLSWFIYPEFRKSNSFFSVLKQNKFFLTVFTIFILWTSGFFTFGKLLSIPEITYKYIFVKELEPKPAKQDYNIHTTSLIKRIIIEDCKIEHIDNFHKLPNEVLHLMIKEVNEKNIPHIVFFKMVDHESGFRFIRNSEGSGAMGYCQIMPATFNQFKNRIGVKKHTPQNNIRMGAFLLSDRYDYYLKQGNNHRKSWFLSLKDYAGGEDSLAREILQLYKNKKGGN
jgi:hypothetical protein